MDEEVLAIGLVLLMMQRSTSPDWGANSAWVFPVPDRPGLPAVISQEFRRSNHRGVDIMYRERGKWVAPVGTPILAARAGVVWSVTDTERGKSVVIDHGPPWATFYQHLEEVKVAKGQTVVAGQEIGTMGSDPTDPQGLRHLHFAVWWKGSGDDASVDPGLPMGAWRRLQVGMWG